MDVLHQPTIGKHTWQMLEQLKQQSLRSTWDPSCKLGHTFSLHTEEAYTFSWWLQEKIYDLGKCIVR